MTTTADMAKLVMWVIYDHPRDRPDKFVARKWEIDGGDIRATATIIEADTLHEVRAKLRGGLVRLARQPNDDPKIVEVGI
jgi:hypothetical protein